MIGIAGISSAQSEVNARVTPLLTATADRRVTRLPIPITRRRQSPCTRNAQAFFAALAGATVEHLHDWPGQ